VVRDHRAHAEAERHPGCDLGPASGMPVLFPSVEAVRAPPRSRPSIRRPGGEGIHRTASTTASAHPQTKATTLYSKLTLAGSSDARSSSSRLAVRRRADRSSGCAGDRGRTRRAGPFDDSPSPRTRTGLWQARHDAYWGGARWPAPHIGLQSRQVTRGDVYVDAALKANRLEPIASPSNDRRAIVMGVADNG